MKEKILELRAQGKTYNEIVNEIGCTKSLVSYYCGEGQKEKCAARQLRNRKDFVLSRKTQSFKGKDYRKKRKCDGFQRLKKGNSFRWEDIVAKFGWETCCYLTGRKIDLTNPKTYQFDHVVPRSKGGSCDLDNLGITCKEANMAKGTMTVDEFVMLCKEVLEHNGFEVKKKSDEPK